MGNAKAALEDAELAIKLRPDWGKGYLRKGMAHRVLGNHTEAFKVGFIYFSSSFTKYIEQSNF